MTRVGLSIILLFILSLSSCKNDKILESNNKPTAAKYLHISHTRTSSNPNLDSIVEGVDYAKFDMLWLGGDVAFLTSQDDNTMLHVDSIFDFADKNTLWSLGNHDYTDLDRVFEFTDRPPFYAYNKNGITFVIIDTQDSLSSIVASQMELLVSVIDTIQEASHLIILHHKLIWMNDGGYLESQIETVSNVEFSNCFYCINPNNFYSDVYPLLVEVKEMGIEVLCIGGDIGIKANEFDHITSDGIQFLASGVSHEADENKALLFHHDIINRQLTWEYKLISDL